MPGVPAAIAAWAAANAAAITAAKIILTAALIVNGVAQARRARKAARAAFEASLRDRTLVIRSADAARTIVLGRAAVSGPLVYACTSGDYQQYLHLVIALGGHEFDAIEDVVFGEASIGTLDANGYVTTGRYFSQHTHPEFVQASVPAGLKVTLPHVPSFVSVTRQEGDSIGTISCTVSGAELTFGASLLGKTVDINYRWVETRPLVRVKKFLGIAAGERDTDLEAASGGQWTANHLGKGVPRLHLTLEYDQDAFPSGIPNIYVIARGLKTYDTRTGTTYWTNNSELCARAYLTHALGFGEPAGAIHDTLVTSQANICDESVPLAVGSHQRYTCDGVLSTEDDRIENLRLILGSMAGMAAYSGGQWLIRAGAYVSPVLDLTDNDLAPGQIEVLSAIPRRDLFNAVRGRFCDPTQYNQVIDFPPYASATYAAQDNGEVIYRDIALPMTAEVHRAQRIGKLFLHRARQATTISATWKLKAQRLQPGDTCRLTIAPLGWSQKIFRVVERNLVQPGTVKMLLQEEASSVYSWSFNEAIEPDPAPDTNLPEPWFVAALDNLSAASGASYYRTLTDGSVQHVMRLTWDQSTDIGVLNGGGLELYIKRSSDAAYQLFPLDGDETSFEYDVANGERYNIAIRARNGAQSRSQYAFAEHQVSGAGKNTVSMGSITGDRLASLPHHGMSITPDPGVEDPSLWILHSGALPERYAATVGSSYTFGKYLWRASAYADLYTKPVPVDKAKAYRAIAYALRDAVGDTCTMYLYVRFFDAAMNLVYYAGSTWPQEGSYNYFGLINALPQTSTKVYEIRFGAGQAAQIPADARFVSIGALMNFSGSGKSYFAGRIQQLQDTDLIAPNAATDVLVIRTAGYSVPAGGSGAGGIRVSGGVGAPDLAWTNNLGEAVDVVIRGSASVAVNVTASNVRTVKVAISDANSSGGTVWPSWIRDAQVAVRTPAVNGTYQGSGAPSYATTVAAGVTVYFNLVVGFESGVWDNYIVSDGQISLEVIKR